MFIEVVLIIFVISIVWALFSLRKEVSRPKEIEHARHDLKKEKIIYRAK